MTTHRSRRETKKYHKHLRNVAATKGDVCEFCEMGPGHPQFIVQTRHFMVVRTLSPYSLWDDHGVAEHLMIIPKAHIDTLAELGPETAAEFLNLIATYEKQGYSIYARPPKSLRRTVVHQHTHLIKITNKQRRLIFYVRPFFRLVR